MIHHYFYLHVSENGARCLPFRTVIGTIGYLLLTVAINYLSNNQSNLKILSNMCLYLYTNWVRFGKVWFLVCLESILSTGFNLFKDLSTVYVLLLCLTYPQWLDSLHKNVCFLKEEPFSRNSQVPFICLVNIWTLPYHPFQSSYFIAPQCCSSFSFIVFSMFFISFCRYLLISSIQE